MSKLTSLITMLVLGTSSVAIADSGLSFHASAQASWGTPASAPVVRDHRSMYAPYHQATRVRGTWVSLSEPMQLARGRGVLDIDSRMSLNQIRLQSASGQAFISTITVQYVNGASQVVTLNQWLDAYNPIAQFNLNRTAQVDSIFINGSRGMRAGMFQVFGYASSTRPEVPVYTPPVYQPPVHQTGMVLASHMSFENTDGRKFLTVGHEKGAFSTLRLQGNSGSTFIEQVVVEFTNGQSQLMSNVDRTLLAGQALDLRLDGGGRTGITRIVVYNNENGVASYGAGTFTATLF